MKCLAQTIVGSTPSSKNLFKGVFASSLKSSLTMGIFWTVLGTFCSRGGTFLISLVLARVLGRSVFGELGVIDATLAMFAIFGSLGLSLTATKFVAKYHVSNPAQAGRILVLCLWFSAIAGISMASLAFVLAPWLAKEQLAAPHLTGHLRWAALMIPFVVVNATLLGGLSGFQAFRSIAIVNVIIALISIPVTTYAGYSWGIRGVVVGYLVTQLMLCGLFFIYLRMKTVEQKVSLSFRGCWDERGVLLKMSLPALLNASLSTPVNWLCVAMLVNSTNGYMEMGVLNVVNVWFLMLLFLPGQLSQVYFPMIESNLSTGNIRAAHGLVWKAVALNLLICSLAAALITLLAEQILLAYGPQYLAAKPVLIVTIGTAWLSAIQQPFAVYLVARSRMWLVFSCSVGWALACYGMSKLLVDWGAMGITVGRFSGYSLYACLSIWLGMRSLKSDSKQPELPYYESRPGGTVGDSIIQERETTMIAA